MSLRAYIRRRKRGLSFFFACVVLSLYFLLHAINGNHGLESRMQLNHEVAKLEKKLAELKKVSAKLDHNISLLQPDKIDPDMLDEQSRTILKYTHPNDIVIFKSSGRH